MNPDDVVKAKVDSQGRVLIPAAIREAMKMKPGGHVAMYLDEDGLHLVTREFTREQLRREIAAHVPEGVSLADELIADRRAEAAREERE
jgi:AbrB family looped-hinge helix DNA binding protein